MALQGHSRQVKLPVRLRVTVPPHQPARPPREPRTPRVATLLRQATEWRRQIDAGEVTSQADIARREGVTRARVTQVMGLLRLAPAIQKRILGMPRTTDRVVVTDRALRPLVRMRSSKRQLRAFRALAAAKK